jgi:MFS family permease
MKDRTRDRLTRLLAATVIVGGWALLLAAWFLLLAFLRAVFPDGWWWVQYVVVAVALFAVVYFSPSSRRRVHAPWRRSAARVVLRAAYRLWPDFEPRVTRLSFAFQQRRGMVVYYQDWQSRGRMSIDDDDNLGARLVYEPDRPSSDTPTDEYARAHDTLHPEAHRYEVGEC